MTNLEDTIFQAHSEIGYLFDRIDEGAQIESVRDDLVTLILGDDSETTINLRPIQRLLDVLRGMEGK